MPQKRQDFLVRTLTAIYTASHQLAAHTHSWHQLLFASSGVMTLGVLHGQSVREEHVVPPHRAVWIPESTLHTVRMSGRVEMRTLYFPPQGAGPRPTRRHSPNPGSDDSRGDTGGSLTVLSVSPLLRELILHTTERGLLRRDDSTHRATKTLLIDQIEAAQKLPSSLPLPHDPRALAAVREFRKRPGIHRGLGDISLAAAASTRTLERLFTKETGLSFGRWKRRALMLEATKRLSVQATSVDAVATDLGYESTSAFIAAFSREIGTTPGRLVKELGQR